MQQYAFYYDQTSCTECGTCLVACKDWNGVALGKAAWREIHKHDKREQGEYPNVKFRPLVYSCQHCSDPACVKACGAGAISKRNADGIVIVDRNKCQGLKACVPACPFGAVKIMDDKQETTQSSWKTAHPAQKCTFCLDRWNNEQKPACVMACPQLAIDAGPVEQILQRYPEAVPATETEGFPADIFNGTHTKPNLYIKKR